ncbi:unnamed protein product [Larinioides sclopetarius]|uniref:Uncharacterized protein n=2 Tax=Larinioides sclopetarius TaxID=280406 RepID=A0AAV2BZW2_9ARAC
MNPAAPTNLSNMMSDPVFRSNLAAIINNYTQQQQNRLPTPGEVIANIFPELVTTPNLVLPNLSENVANLASSSENVANLATINSLNCTSENTINLELPVTNLELPNLVEDDTQKEDASSDASSDLECYGSAPGPSKRKRKVQQNKNKKKNLPDVPHHFLNRLSDKEERKNTRAGWVLIQEMWKMFITGRSYVPLDVGIFHIEILEEFTKSIRDYVDKKKK